MIGPDVPNGSGGETMGVLALMRSLESESAAEPRAISPESLDLYYDALEARSEENQFERVRRTLRLDPGNIDAILLLLERYLKGDLPGAEQALTEARRQNPHTESWLRGRKRLPREMPDMYSPGNREEAVAFVLDLHEAWDAQPEAKAWLLKQRKSA